MLLHNPQFPGPSECPDAIWQMIPWYVNGSLSAEQAQPVRLHGKICTQCAAEIERQRRLARDVAKTDLVEVPLARSWETLRAQIEAEDRSRAPKASERRRFGGLQGAFAGLSVAALAAVMVVMVQPSDTDFQTLTTEAQTATHIIKFQVAPDVAVDQLDHVLAEFSGTLVSGPSDVGVYVAAFPEGADMQAVADAFMATPEIIFAAPEAGQ